MKKTMLFGFLTLLGSLSAQTTIQATLSPPSVPTVDLGSDTTVTANTPVSITANTTSGTGPFSYSWTPASAVDDPTAQVVVATVATSTLLEVVVTDANGCIANDDINVFVSGLSTDNETFQFGLSPNPSTGVVTLRMPFGTRGTILVHTLNGALLYEKSVTSETAQLDLSHLSDGVYMLSVVTENQVGNERIIIKK